MHFAKRDVARGVGPIRDNENRGALPRALHEHRERRDNCIVDRRTPPGFEPAERAAHHLRSGRPSGQDVRLMIEGKDEILVGVVQQVEEEILHGGVGIFQALAEHAIAGVEENGEADRNALVRKLRNGLCLPVFVYLERVTPQVGHQPSLVVAYRRRNTRDLYARPKEAIVAKDLILADDRRAGQKDRKKEIQAEANTHLAILPPNSTGSTCLSAREALRVTTENRRPSAPDRPREISVESGYGGRALHQYRVVAVGRGAGRICVRPWKRDVRYPIAVRRRIRLAAVCGELERSRPRHIHGGRRTVPPPPSRGVLSNRRRHGDPSSARATLPGR